MHPTVFAEFGKLIGALQPKGRILEIGATLNRHSLLALPDLAGQERVGVNLEIEGEFLGFRILKCNGNHMPMFANDSFDCVLSNATLEHDRYFWRTCTEIRRVLKPGGLAMIGVPGYSQESGVEAMGLPAPFTGDEMKDWSRCALTFRYHGAPSDYYRFSEDAVREVFFEGFENVEIKTMMAPPRIIGWGRRA